MSATLTRECHEAVAQWHWLGMQVRMGLTPSSPKAIRQFFNAGGTLIAGHGCTPWLVHERHMELLINTISDARLPAHWRQCCLDHCHQPLNMLRQLSLCDCSDKRCRYWSWQVANVVIDPAQD